MTRKKKTSLRHAVETMHLTNVLVVPDMNMCNLFSCASAYKNDGIQTHLNSDRHLVLPSGAHVDFASSKKHYSIGVNVGSKDSAYVASTTAPPLTPPTPPTSRALPRVTTLSCCTSASAIFRWRASTRHRALT